MLRPAVLLGFGLGSPAAAAWLAHPFVRSSHEQSWEPPRKTDRPVIEEQVALGWSPKPTEPPKLAARMDLFPRMEGYTLGTDTCGFVESDAQSYTCITNGASCHTESGYLGCCVPNKPCNIIKRTCIDYSAVLTGACQLPDDFHTLCCATESLGACYTYTMTSTGKGGAKDSILSLLACSASKGIGNLLDYDPAWARTHTSGGTGTAQSGSSSGTETGTSGQTTGTGGSDNNNKSSGGGGGTPIGAIVGGVVGGIGALALVGLAAFLLLRHKKKTQAGKATLSQTSSPPQQQQPPMAQNGPQSPGYSCTTSSPTNGGYPSGVPTGYQGYPPQGHDAHMSTYNELPSNQQPQYPQEVAANPAQQPHQQQQYQQEQFQGQYPSQSQGYQNQYTTQYGPPLQGSSPTASPPPQGTSPLGTSVSPVHGVDGPHNRPQPSELETVNPVGMETNRAELGPNH